MEHSMYIVRRSKLTGREHVMNLDITEEQIQAHLDGGYIQDVMPHLNADQREFYLTGITPEEWDTFFGEED